MFFLWCDGDIDSLWRNFKLIENVTMMKSHVLKYIPDQLQWSLERGVNETLGICLQRFQRTWLLRMQHLQTPLKSRRCFHVHFFRKSSYALRSSEEEKLKNNEKTLRKSKNNIMQMLPALHGWIHACEHCWLEALFPGEQRRLRLLRQLFAQQHHRQLAWILMKFWKFN